MVTLRIGVSSVTVCKKQNPAAPHNSKNMGFETRLQF